MAKIAIGLNYDVSTCGWRSKKVLIDDGTTMAGLAKIVQSDSVCEFDPVIERVTKGWNKSSELVRGGMDYHTDASPDVVGKLDKMKHGAYINSKTF